MKKHPDLERSVSELTQAIGLLVRRVRAATAPQELSWSESAVLGRLARGGPATTAELARAEAVKPQSMGTTIAALAAMGLVVRKPHPTDGRQIHIRLTAQGAAMRKRIKDAKHTWLAQAVSKLDPRDQETVFAAGEIFKRLAER
ncbi:MAG TPA: MarR family transcriptional regulator [Thermoanaerobaculaceae bacterium]|nr:MarR family transcriptional regulator [Thermoanaerobaculaceae bacterium]